jgi:hypothetical protein
MSLCKVPLFLSDCNENLITSTDFRKILMYKISRKSVQWEQSCSMRDGQPDDETDMTKLIVAFRKFSKATKTKQ